MRDDIDIVPVAPDLELLCRSGPEGICRSQHYALSVLLLTMCQLSDRSRLAAAVDPYHHHDERSLFAQLVAFAFIYDLYHYLFERLLHIVRSCVIKLLYELPRILNDLHRRVHTDIGRDQNFFDIIEQRLVYFRMDVDDIRYLLR